MENNEYLKNEFQYRFSQIMQSFINKGDERDVNYLIKKI